MIDEEKVNNEKGQEKESIVPEEKSTFEDVVKTKNIEVEESMVEVERIGNTKISDVEQVGGSSEEFKEMKDVVEETKEEAEEAKERYEEELKNIPNAGDLAESFKKKDETEEIKQENKTEDIFLIILKNKVFSEVKFKMNMCTLKILIKKN